MTRRLLALLTAVPLLVACGGADPVATDPVGAQELPVGEFVGVDLPAPFADGDQVRATIADDQISFQATCNSMSGSIVLDGDVVVVDGVGGTEIGCPGAGHEQDEWLVEFFTSRPTLDLRDVGFSLRGESGEVMLVPPGAAPGHDDRPLEGTRWVLTGIEETDGDSVSMTPPLSPIGATLEITDTDLVMETGCNTASATVRVRGEEVEVARIFVTQRGCPGGPDLERLQLQVLEDGFTWSVDGDQLRLTRGDTALLYRTRSSG